MKITTTYHLVARLIAHAPENVDRMITVQITGRREIARTKKIAGQRTQRIPTFLLCIEHIEFIAVVHIAETAENGVTFANCIIIGTVMMQLHTQPTVTLHPPAQRMQVQTRYHRL